MGNNLWILTEERPKREVLHNIIQKFAEDKKFEMKIDNKLDLSIIPVLDENGNFGFMYKVLGIHLAMVNDIFICIVSGNSSFVDFLVFYQKEKPNKESDIPLYLIEETKTSDQESRNTGVFQRASKFVFSDLYYRNVKKIMLYSLRIEEKNKLSRTNEFGSRCLETIGVQILGKSQAEYMPFESIEELIKFKNSMRRPPKSNTPILIAKYDNKITISGRLWKADKLSHDPNIGAISLISATLRTLGFYGEIEVVDHGLAQEQVGANNKFLHIANLLGISLENIDLPVIQNNDDYWRYETRGEKIVTIFLHLLVEKFTKARVIYENHAGCERGYFITKNNDNLSVAKYKNGDKNEIIFIPDLVIADDIRKKIIVIEGKKIENVSQGIIDLENYTNFENIYIKKYYSDYDIIRMVVLFGGRINKQCILKLPKINLNDVYKIGVIMTENGAICFKADLVEILKDAINNLYNLNESDYGTIKLYIE